MTLETKGISKYIGKKSILNDCSIKIKPGCFTAVVGPNGAGKTTLLKSLSGEDKPSTGKIVMNYKPLDDYQGKELAINRAILPQQTIVNFPFTVEQVIEIGRYPHNTSRTENEAIIQEVMRQTALERFSGRIYQTLSGGEKQRVQMARVMAQLHHETDLTKYLLLDEPTSSLDLAQQHALLSIAKDLCGSNIGVLAVLHDLNLALQYADEILFLKLGQTVAYGKSEEVVTEETIEDTFSYPVTLLENQGRKIIVPKYFKENFSAKTKQIAYEHSN